VTAAARRAWWLVWVWVAAQLVITSVPGSAVPVDVGHPFDWVVHTGIYGMLGLLVARAAGLASWPPRRLAWVGMAIAAAAALDEVHQLVIPGRNGSPADWGFDTVGVAAGLLFGSWVMGSKAARWLR
jgi:VanZ family protein